MRMRPLKLILSSWDSLLLTSNEVSAAHIVHLQKKESREALINDSGEAPDIVVAKDKNSDARE